MKRLALLLLLCASCSMHIMNRPIAEQNENGRAVMHLIGRFSFGHACPVDGYVLSAAHMVEPFYKTEHLRAMPMFFAWSDQIGNAGYLMSAEALPSRDIGAFYVVSGTPSYYKHSLKEPEVDTEVYYVEYDNSDPYACRRRDTKIIRVLSGHMIFDEAPLPGASGGCLFSKKSGEVVGIVVWAARMGPTRVVGVAVSIAGQWWPGK